MSAPSWKMSQSTRSAECAAVWMKCGSHGGSGSPELGGPDAHGSTIPMRNSGWRGVGHGAAPRRRSISRSGGGSSDGRPAPTAAAAAWPVAWCCCFSAASSVSSCAAAWSSCSCCAAFDGRRSAAVAFAAGSAAARGPPPYDGGAGARWSSCAGSAVSSWRSTTRHSSDASSISAARRCAARLCRSERAKSRAFINWLSIFIRTTLKTSDGTEPASPWKVSFSRRGEMSMSAMPPAAERESIAEIARRAQKWPPARGGGRTRWCARRSRELR